MHKRGHMPSCGVCLSVLLSATFVYCVKMHNNCISKIFSPSDGHTILVFTYHTLWQYSDGNPVWMVQKSRFSTDIWLWDRWLVESRQQFRPWSNLQHEASTSVYRADRHASVNLVYDNKPVRICRMRRREQSNLIVWTGKSEAEVTSNKRLRLR